MQSQDVSWLFGRKTTVAERKDNKDDDKQSIKSTTSTVEETTNSEDSDTSCTTSSSDTKSVHQSRKRSGLAQRVCFMQAQLQEVHLQSEYIHKSKCGKNKDVCSHCRTCGNSCYAQQWDWDDDTDNWSTDYGSAGHGSYYTQGRGRSLRRPQQT